MDEPFRGVAYQIIGRPAQRRRPSRIDVDNLSIQVGDHKKVLGELPDPVTLPCSFTINFLTNQTLQQCLDIGGIWLRDVVFSPYLNR
jgi:hypothetical protein